MKCSTESHVQYARLLVNIMNVWHSWQWVPGLTKVKYYSVGHIVTSLTLQSFNWSHTLRFPTLNFKHVEGAPRSTESQRYIMSMNVISATDPGPSQHQTSARKKSESAAEENVSFREQGYGPYSLVQYISSTLVKETDDLEVLWPRKGQKPELWKDNWNSSSEIKVTIIMPRGYIYSSTSKDCYANWYPSQLAINCTQSL